MEIHTHKIGGRVFGNNFSETIPQMETVIKNTGCFDKNMSHVVIISGFGDVTNRLLQIAQSGDPYPELRALYHQYAEQIDLLHKEGSIFEKTYSSMKFWHAECKDNHFQFIHEYDRRGEKNFPIFTDKRLLDTHLSFGEIFSTKIVYLYLLEKKLHHLPLSHLDATRMLVTDDVYGNAVIDFEESQKLIDVRLQNLTIPHLIVTEGFIGKTKEGKITTLGREGSDYSAAAFARLMKSKSLTLWKDVDGIYNLDPKIHGNAKMYEKLQFEKMQRKSKHGMKIVHKKVAETLMGQNIPLRIRSFFKLDNKGTLIY